MRAIRVERRRPTPAPLRLSSATLDRLRRLRHVALRLAPVRPRVSFHPFCASLLVNSLALLLLVAAGARQSREADELVAYPVNVGATPSMDALAPAAADPEPPPDPPSPPEPPPPPETAATAQPPAPPQALPLPACEPPAPQTPPTLAAAPAQATNAAALAAEKAADAATLDAYWAEVRRGIARYLRYPQAARIRGSEGVVSLRLSLDGDGRLLAICPLTPAADPSLREAGIRAVRRAAPFPPLIAARAGSIPLTADVPIRFQLVAGSADAAGGLPKSGGVATGTPD